MFIYVHHILKILPNAKLPKYTLAIDFLVILALIGRIQIVFRDNYISATVL